MILIKLGGSFITYKKDDCLPPYYGNEIHRRYRIREDLIRKVAKVIKEHNDKKFILIHGGGTHGHRTVVRWREGVTKGSVPMMAWEVRWRMDQLTATLIRIMGEEKVPAISIPTSDIVISDSGNIIDLSTKLIGSILERDCVPVLRGDFVPDVNGDWSVVSGDTLIKEISRVKIEGGEEIRQVIMIMDKEGFIDPLTGKVIGEVNEFMFERKQEEWKRSIFDNQGDVSGGIWGKVIVCRELADNGIETFLIGGDIVTNLERVLSGGRAGTRFPRREK